MKTILRRASLASLAAPFVCCALASDVGAQIPLRTVTLGINVNPHKPSGETWDAFGGAPDIAI